MPDIILTTLNAKFIHAAFGLRYLYANLGDLQPQTEIAEFDINLRPLDIAEALLARAPRIIGFGIYIWNVAPTTEVIGLIRRVRPEIKIILGGPEVSYETSGQRIVELADHVITGEADLKFAEVCRVLLNSGMPPLPGQGTPNHIPATLPKIMAADLPELSRLALPYDFYTPADLANRIIYVEASRGCPFTCEFCLSSLEIPVRQVPLEKFLGEMQKLLDRGLRQFKFVDRTFNLNLATSKAILEFFRSRYQPGLFYHFEMIPDRLPAELRTVIAQFPPGALQFEVGIQTFNPEVGRHISRRQDYLRLAENFQFLRNETGVHIHADLIVGLPGETLESLGAGFDRLIALRPQEIQIGILKRLRGTPITRHDAEWQMVYNPHPPYEILQNKLLDFAIMQRLRRLAKYWDLVGNSGNFATTLPLIWSAKPATDPAGKDHPPESPATVPKPSPFGAFLRFSDWLYGRLQRTDTIALNRLMELVFEYLTKERVLDPKAAAQTLWHDCERLGRRDHPHFLKEFLPRESKPPLNERDRSLPKRQSRHMASL